MRIFEGIDGAFAPSDVLRGRAYAAQGRVELLECTPTRVRARVHGTAPYRVEIGIVDDEHEYHCSCPAFERAYACKHLWATVEVARRELIGASGASQGPATRGRARAAFDAGDDAHDDMPEDEFPWRRGARATAGHADTSGPARESWRAQLAALAHAAPFTPTSTRTRTVAYGLEPAPHGDRCRVLAWVATSRPAAGGQRATWRRLRGLDLGALASEDRALVEALPDPEGGFDAHAPETWWSLGPEWQAIFLPRLVATGRAHLARAGELDPEPLVADDATFVFRLALARETASESSTRVAPAPKAATALITSSAVPTVTASSAIAASHAGTPASGAREGRESEVLVRGELTSSVESGARTVVSLDACDAVFAAGFCVRGRHFARVDWRGAATWAAMLRRAPVRAPASALDEVVETLLTCPPRVEIETHDVLATVSATPRPILRLFGVDPRTGRVPAEFACDYGGTTLVPCEEHRFFRRARGWVRVARDRAAEDRFQELLDTSGVRADERGDLKRWVDVDDLSRVVEGLTQAGWLVEAEGVPLRGASAPKIAVRSGVDWFDVDVEVDFGAARAALPDLLRALREKRRFVTLSDDSLGLLPERWLRSWEMLGALGTAVDGASAVRVPRAGAWLLSAWLDEHEAHVEVDDAFRAWRERLHAGLRPRALSEPAGFVGELRPYQREGLGWLESLRELGSGGCLADDMGLGKTVMVLAMIQGRRAEARGPALVVVPASVVFNWEREARRFTPELDVRVHHGTTRDRAGAAWTGADVLVTTYGTLRRDVEAFARVEFDCAVLDEAQTIKNPASQVARATRTLKARARFALTGTPVENHLGDLFSIFRFVEPALFQGSPRVREWLRGAQDDVELARVVSRGLRPFLLRRTKEDVLLDLPPKTEQIVECVLPPAQRRAYDELRRHYRAELLSSDGDLDLQAQRMNVLEALLRLRQAACHPGLVDPEQVEAESGKLDALLPMLEDVAASGHKGLVFSQFTSFLALVRARLDALGIAYEYLDGRTRNRAERVDRFQDDPKVPLFLVSLKAGGAGLNLTAADYVFLLDPWWNPAAEAQAIDRTHRIGQRRAVTAYRFVAHDTVEEKVLALQEKKRALAAALFESAGATLRDLTREDLDWLLT